jgi:hypothetical protein
MHDLLCCFAHRCHASKVGHVGPLNLPSALVPVDQDVLRLEVTVGELQLVQLTQLVVDLVGKSRSGVVLSSQADCER